MHNPLPQNINNTSSWSYLYFGLLDKISATSAKARSMITLAQSQMQVLAKSDAPYTPLHYNAEYCMRILSSYYGKSIQMSSQELDGLRAIGRASFAANWIQFLVLTGGDVSTFINGRVGDPCHVVNDTYIPDLRHNIAQAQKQIPFTPIVPYPEPCW